MNPKNLPPPDDDELAAALRRRYHDDEPAATTGDTTRTPRTSASDRTRATSATPADSVRRSWYMPRATAEALAAAIDDLHFATRRPKAEVIAALVAVALDRQDDIRQRLTGEA